MNKKRIFAVLTVLTLCISMLAGCAPSTPAEPAQKIDINIGGLKGPTSLGMLKLMEDNEAGTAANNYNFTIAGAPEEITAKLINGELDIAAVPTNLASVLYNKTEGELEILALNTLGILYVVEAGTEPTITSIEDLKGKTIYSTGQAAVPEYALNYILKGNNLEPGTDVTIEYKSEHSELAALMAAGEAQFAVLPEPFVTAAMKQNPNMTVVLNLTDEWAKVAGKDSVLAMGAIVARKDFVSANKANIDAFLDEYKASTEYTNANVEDAAVLSEKYDIIPAPVAKDAIPKCNIVYIDGAEMKTDMQGFLKILYDFNPKAIGGKLPADDFYYAK
jgi:NitT/TauT family transport system substrate-binding protein